MSLVQLTNGQSRKQTAFSGHVNLEVQTLLSGERIVTFNHENVKIKAGFYNGDLKILFFRPETALFGNEYRSTLNNNTSFLINKIDFTIFCKKIEDFQPVAVIAQLGKEGSIAKFPIINQILDLSNNSFKLTNRASATFVFINSELAIAVPTADKYDGEPFLTLNVLGVPTNPSMIQILINGFVRTDIN